MSTPPIEQVLAQIRSLSGFASTSLTPPALGSTTATNSSAAPAFAQLLKQGVDAVNSSQQSADALAAAWERGAPGVDLARVMIETQKASVSFQALTQVRNRLISAYQDIMNMSI
jgi:flagellar hook-basal body complex protein FliE